jgi:RNA polymerase sigma-70 factor (ECF subfamily)
LVDLTVIEECRRGDLKNFGEVARKVTPYAFSLAFRMVGDEAAARDIAQESVISLWKGFSSVRSPEALKPWIYRTVINKCYDELRRRKRSITVNASESDWDKLSSRLSDVNRPPMENEEIALIISLLTESLSPAQKSVFILSELEGMEADEISAVTGMGKSKIKANLWHARTRMKDLIKKHL